MDDFSKEFAHPIPINKPEGISSAGVVSRVKRHFGLAKVGHAGTLDPNATGVLILLTNKACKEQDSFMGGKKRYEGEIQLGLSSSTDDIWGELEGKLSLREIKTTIENKGYSSPEEIAIALKNKFTGKISQIPPKVSAVKISGKRAYKRARLGEDFQIKPRNIEIYSGEYTPIIKNNNYYISYNIHCSKGTYVRSLARDIGEFLGVGGVAKSIRRTLSEPFAINNSVKLEDLLSMNEETLSELYHYE